MRWWQRNVECPMWPCIGPRPAWKWLILGCASVPCVAWAVSSLKPIWSIIGMAVVVSAVVPVGWPIVFGRILSRARQKCAVEKACVTLTIRIATTLPTKITENRWWRYDDCAIFSPYCNPCPRRCNRWWLRRFWKLRDPTPSWNYYLVFDWHESMANWFRKKRICLNESLRFANHPMIFFFFFSY